MRRFLALLVCAALVMALAGCASSSQDSSGMDVSPGVTAPSEQPAEVTPAQQSDNPDVEAPAEAAPEAQSAPARVPVTQTVYVTKTGSKYHTATCSYLRQSKRAMSLGDALSEGYSACSRCNP